MDGDQKLNIMSLCLYQQWQGVTEQICRVSICNQAIYIANPMMPKQVKSCSHRCSPVACGLLVSIDLPRVAQGKQGLQLQIVRREGYFHQRCAKRDAVLETDTWVDEAILSSPGNELILTAGLLCDISGKFSPEQGKNRQIAGLTVSPFVFFSFLW